MKNEKKVMLLSLTILAILLTGFTWAYWNSAPIEKPKVANASNTIKVGTGEKADVITTLNVSGPTQNPQGDPLVPKTINEEKSKVLIEYVVTWETESDHIKGAVGDLKFYNEKLVIKGDEQNTEANELLKNLFVISSEFESTSLTIRESNNNDSTTLKVSVEFEIEPKNLEEYNLIANKSLDLSFSVELTPKGN